MDTAQAALVRSRNLIAASQVAITELGSLILRTADRIYFTVSEAGLSSDAWLEADRLVRSYAEIAIPVEPTAYIVPEYRGPWSWMAWCIRRGIHVPSFDFGEEITTEQVVPHGNGTTSLGSDRSNRQGSSSSRRDSTESGTPSAHHHTHTHTHGNQDGEP